MHWYKSTGWMEWYFDGVLYDSFDYSARVSGGPVDAAVIEWDNNASHNDEIYYDDVKAGTIPEPATLLLLGLGGLLSLRRRR
ncbi:MAG: PEP-CTERM sorting domain-containing protein [Planctomycetes bacterium]|nr:PEP-CTERM sorting domain-containing protein [Planctomycetota bacterium]